MKFTEPAMRPPQEAQSLLLRASQGCTYNACRFCYVSRGYPFGAASIEQFEKEILARRAACPPDTRVYLTGSNPFALSTATLAAFLQCIEKHLPQATEVSLQSRIADIRGKSLRELRELRSLGLGHLYIGVENGHDEILKRMNKGHTSSEAIEQLLRLDEADIAYTTYYIIGMGGRGMGKAGGEATAAMFNQVHPRRITSTGMTVFPGTPLEEMARSGTFAEATEREKIEELLVFLQHLAIDTFFDAVHYLNPLNYRCAVAREKESVIEDIKDVLQTYSDEELEKMVSRAFMRSL